MLKLESKFGAKIDNAHLPCYLQSRVSLYANVAFTIFTPVLKYLSLLTSLRHICHEKNKTFE